MHGARLLPGDLLEHLVTVFGHQTIHTHSVSEVLKTFHQSCTFVTERAALCTLVCSSILGSSLNPPGLSHLVQLVEVSRHQTDQLTGADLIQDPAGQLQCLKSSKSQRSAEARRQVKLVRRKLVTHRALSTGTRPHRSCWEAFWEYSVRHAKVFILT